MKHLMVYLNAVAWIAMNDEPRDMDVGSVSEMISVALVADLFFVKPEKVARDIITYRERRG
jgi:hypothetical protein